MPFHIMFTQINAALSDDTLVGLNLLDVLAAFVTDSKPGSRARVVDRDRLGFRVDEAVRVAIDNGQCTEAADALFLICLGASGAELRGLFEAMSMTGTMASLFRLTCDPAIAEVKVTYKACVVIALVRGWSPIVLCMRGCLPYICTISACISHDSSIVLPMNVYVLVCGLRVTCPFNACLQCMRGCLSYICTISACISHESSIVLPMNRTQCVYLPYCQ